jgi:hypothetical protein
MTPNDLLKYVKTEYDRLSEISPLVPPNIIEDFKLRFSDAKYDAISRPEDTNGLHAIHIFSREDADTPHLEKNAVFFPEELHLSDLEKGKLGGGGIQ